MIYDCVVIGAGVSGMASALLLARQGMNVCLLEQAPAVGPLLRGFTRGKVHFDTGFHYAGDLGPGEPLGALLACLNIGRHLRPRPLDPEGFDVFIEPDGGGFAFPCGEDRIRERFAEAFPAEREAVAAYLREVRRVADVFPYGDPEGEWEGDQPRPLPLSDVTLREILDRLTGDERLKRFLSAHCFLHGTPAEEVAFGIHAAVVAGYYRSAWRIEGGGKSVVTAFEREIGNAGVTTACGRSASRLLFSPGGELAGVETRQGDRFACRRVISTLHPRALLDLVEGDRFRNVYRRRLHGFEESASAVILHAACERPPSLLGDANILLLPEAGLGFGRPGFDTEDRSIYVTAAWSARDPNRTAGWSALCPVPPSVADPWSGSARNRRPEGYLRFKEEVRGRLLRRLETAYPDWTASVAASEVTTPLTLRDHTAAPVGGLYGIKHRAGSPSPLPVTRVGGLFLAGEAVAAPGLFGALVSAFLACGHIVGHDRLREVVRKAC